MSYFFENQKKAKAKSRNIILVFVLFLTLQLTGLYYLVHKIIGPVMFSDDLGRYLYQDQTFDKFAFIGSAGFAVVILILFFYKRFSFFSNPSSLPEQMSATEISFSSQNPTEQMYYNVVSEMALASGIPMPKVYVLRQEQAVNAFTSGYNHQNANVVVTQGALESFTREELQAVVAHEFGHIVSGDVRSNINLLAVYFSFSAVFIVGMRLFQILGRSGRYRSRSSKKGDGAGQLMLIALAVVVVGAIGAFVSRIVSAMFSRQREYLADALSVQFTRYPAALGSALAKIRDGKGSVLEDVRGAEVSAICFSSSLKWMASVYDTHPPIDSRIKKVDPAFIAVGSSFKKRVIDADLKKENLKAAMNTEKSLQYLATMGLLTENDISHASSSLEAVSKSNLSTYLNPENLEPLVYALLMDSDTSHFLEQKNFVLSNCSNEISKKVLMIYELIHENAHIQKTSLVELLVPLFSQIPASVSMRIMDTTKQIVDLDGKVTAYESFLFYFIKKYNYGLEKAGGGPSPADIVHLINQMAYLNSGDKSVVESSRKEALRVYFNKEVSGAKTPSSMETVFARLPKLPDQDKKKLVKALLKAITFDQHLNRQEFECFRIVCDALEVPAPPVNIK